MMNSLPGSIFVMMKRLMAVCIGMCGVILLGLPHTHAVERIENPVAVFAALDKVSARIQHLEIPLNETMQFGALLITPRVCYSRPPTEPPFTSAFIEVEEVKLDESHVKLFTGWMFAESPGIHGVEHPVFDVWLTSCKTS